MSYESCGKRLCVSAHRRMFMYRRYMQNILNLESLTTRLFCFSFERFACIAQVALSAPNAVHSRPPQFHKYASKTFLIRNNKMNTKKSFISMATKIDVHQTINVTRTNRMHTHFAWVPLDFKNCLHFFFRFL